MAAELTWVFQVKNTFVHVPDCSENAVGSARRRSQSEPANSGRSLCGTAADDGTHRGAPRTGQLNDDCESCLETKFSAGGSTRASFDSERQSWGRSSHGSDSESADEDTPAEGCWHESLVVEGPDFKGTTSVSWKVDVERLEGSEHKVSSPEFHLAIPGLGWCSFQLLLYAANRRKVLTFEQAKGQGRVELKCLDTLPSVFGCIPSNIKIGSQAPRGWVVHDFSRVAQRSERRVDFGAMAGPGSRTVCVEAEIAPLPLGPSAVA